MTAVAIDIGHGLDALARRVREIAKSRNFGERLGIGGLRAPATLEAAINDLLTAADERDDALAAQAQAEGTKREAEQRVTQAQRDIAALEAARQDLGQQLASLDAKFKTLVDSTGASLDTILAQPLIEGRVLEVNRTIEPGLVALNVGAESGVQRGFVFHVFRGEQYLGKVRVENVRPTMSTALIQGTFEGRDLRQGDQAATRL